MNQQQGQRGLPTGGLTFMFSDIEGSTQTLQQIGDEAFGHLLDQHHQVIREALAGQGGIEVSTEGDSFFAVFTDPVAAVRSATEIHMELAQRSAEWPSPVKVRIGLHTGIGMLGGDNYIGVDVHKASRIASAAHGGETLLSDSLARLVRDGFGEESTISLGRFRLQGFSQVEMIHRLALPGLDTDFHAPRARRADARLPNTPTEFVGRDRDIEVGLEALQTRRLVTLSGPAGTGKTRLAIEIARHLETEFADGVVFVPLASLNDTDLVVGAIIDVLELQLAGGIEPTERLVRYLAERQMLLVLDNLEQLSEVAAVVAAILDAAPGVKVLATSRVPLRLGIEHEIRVPPLEVPDDDATQEAIAAVAGVRLFTNRAAAVRPGFELTAQNARTVAGIARSLDGLPLAIELAASRMRSLTPEIILERLGNQLLAAPSSDLPARQQTIVNAIGWSYDLLTPRVRSVFEELSVFSGSFGLTEAEQVCSDQEDVLDCLIDLVEQSLLRQTETSGDPRFRMLTVIRDFGYAALVARGDEAEVTARHGRVFSQLADTVAKEILTSRQLMWLGRVGIELDNFRAAFDHAVATGDQDTALTISGSLWRYWQIRGLLDEAKDRLEIALNMAPDGTPALRARALTGLGGILYWQGDWDATIEPYREALEIHLALGDRAGIAEALYNLSFPRGYAGDYDEMERLLRESLDLSEEIGWRIGVGRAYWALANMASYSEDWDSSIDFARKAADVFIKEDAPFDLGWAWFMVAHGYARSSRTEEAREAILSALEIFTKVRDVSALTLIFETISYVILLLGDGEAAAYFGGVAARIKEDTGVQIGDVEVIRFPQLRTHLDHLNETEQAHYDAGFHAPLEEYVDQARQALARV
jgi:predicted ATPase/class 3 adenylate cyclase